LPFFFLGDLLDCPVPDLGVVRGLVHFVDYRWGSWMPAVTTTQRTIKFLRDRGYTCCVVEKFNAFAGQRMDVFGIIDILAIKSGEPGVLGVQSTTCSNLSSHRHKILENKVAKLWLDCGNRLWLVGWHGVPQGPKNVRHTWIARIEELRRSPDEENCSLDWIKFDAVSKDS
jgi:hypothetical protein